MDINSDNSFGDGGVGVGVEGEGVVLSTPIIFTHSGVFLKIYLNNLL